jgi:Xaa-Pro dipeptidase
MTNERWTRVWRSIRAEGLDAIALNAGPSLFYLTGLSFHLMERPVVGLFSPDEAPRLVLPELERSKAEGTDLMLFPYGEDEASRTEAFSQAAHSLHLAGGAIGLEPTRLRVLELRLLEAAAPGAKLVPAGPALANLRSAKDQAELVAIRRAMKVAELALAATVPLIRVGMTERQVASELTLQLLRAGSDTELPFPPIVASGPNSALPHAVPSDRRLQARDMLILDWGATVDHYISDLTRTFVVGESDPELARIHAIVEQANAAGREAIRPGVACGEVDRAARDVIQKAGYGQAFTHRTGHGIGLEAHEPPYIHAGSLQRLEAGMTFTVEPGIYLPGRGGARVEDNVAVTSEGVETLSQYPRGLTVIG